MSATEDDMGGESTGNLRILKAIVIGLGVLIMLAFIALVWGIVHKAGELKRPAAAAGQASAPFDWAARAALPAGAQILAAGAAEGRLIVTIKTGEGAEIRLFDLATGQPAGVLALSPVAAQ